MKLQLISPCHGFILEEANEVKEINSFAYTFYHEKSGARLLYLQNDDDNKVFSITFRTPPPDSTGLPHILEHSVLCGSRKFPLKEPFVELIKGSLNTFLNAMTFSDKTMYPVASKNDKDFHNLMDVYLDAVFYPNIYQHPEILMQEGWHYELENADEPISYKGVVYNEMKGVFSSPESVMERKVQEALFPDTAYGVESGGDPDHIPELTQEQFLNFHKKYYHPSNSFLYLYGAMDIMAQLKFLDTQYLSNFDKIAVDSKIAWQQPFDKPKTLVVEYPISASEKVEGKTFLSMNFVVGSATEPELCLAFNILNHILLGTPGAPLKKALIDAGIGKDVVGSYDGDILQPVFSIVARNADCEQANYFERIVLDTLREVAANGLDKSLVEASINAKEFQLREANYGVWPKGLIYNIKCMNSWLYDAQPVMHIEYEHALQAVKAALTERYFESIIEKYLLQNKHSATVIVSPKPGLGEEKAQLLRQRLADYKAMLKPDEIVALVEQTKNLKERQATPDAPEALNSIPLLALGDIDPKTSELPLEERQLADVKILAHPLFTNKIAYLDLYFDAGAVPEGLLPYLALLSSVLGKISTASHHYSDLSNQINLHTGGISYTAKAYEEKSDENQIKPKFVVKSKALVGKLPQLTELLGEILVTSQFDDFKRLQEIISEIKAKMDRVFVEQGHIVAMQRLLSYFSPLGKYAELGGLTFYRFITELEKNFMDRAEETARNLAEVARVIFNKKALIVSITMGDDDYPLFEQSLPQLLERLGNATVHQVTIPFKNNPLNEGLMTSSKVQYVAKGYNYKSLGYSYSGTLKVLETILRFDYLWNQVRVQGGAYGAFAQFDRNGSMIMASYRDPNLIETLSVYDKAVDYIKEFTISDREMTKYIIGTMSKLDVPLTPSMKGEKATVAYIQKNTLQDAQQERDEILSTRQADIRECASMVEAVMKIGYLCAVGNEEKLRENEKYFGALVNVFE